MRIRYKKKRLYANLILGIIWIAFGVFMLYEDGNSRFTKYGYLVIGVLYIIPFLYNFKYQYLLIENGVIKKNTGFGKTLSLKDIISIKKFAGDYTLITENEKMKINTELIDKNSLVELNKVLDKLELPVEKSQLTKNS